MTERRPRVVRDMWDAILNDEWMWLVVWGVQRGGKTTFAMQLAYTWYKDWDKVLQSFVFNLSGLMYKVEKGEPERVPTLNKLHMRVPILIYDDFGAHSNKAETQYDRAWDTFKGGFDVLATRLAVLIATMVDPTEPTYQIMQKYTHEVFIPKRGVYKYDRVLWDQDYKGWKPKRRKEWIETNVFEPVPKDVYQEYDQMRMALVDEVIVRVKDALAESRVDYIIKRLKPEDIELMQLIRDKGMISYERFRERNPDALPQKYKDALIRCKARDLIVPIRKKSTYWYDLTDLGLEVLEAIDKQQALQNIPRDQAIYSLIKTKPKKEKKTAFQR